MQPRVNLIWFRRDLRLTDHTALYHALRAGLPVIPVFIFDRNILEQLEDKSDRRVAFIHAALEGMQQQLVGMGSSLEVYHGTPAEVWSSLLEKYAVHAVYANHDYEPYALERDAAIAALLREKGVAFHTYKDQVIFEKQEVVKDDGKPYTVFTPYARKWKERLQTKRYQVYPVEELSAFFYQQSPQPIPSLATIGFKPIDIPSPLPTISIATLQHYAQQRDQPALEDGTTKMGVHLRFGTVSVRQLVSLALQHSDVYLSELIWREFYQSILWHFPQVGKGASFKPAYDLIPWRNNEAEFQLWCAGRTGYPMVDAGMRQLNTTGYMHNRVRMIVASFLSKHLLIDWRWGEAYFAQKLLDYDLAANNGGWQWASGSGCDAAPYFRVFNPTLQVARFDSQQVYIRKWIPEWGGPSYPAPMVAHEFARKRALDVYGKALNNR